MSLISIPETKEYHTSITEMISLTKQHSGLEQRVDQLEKEINDLNERYRANVRLVIKSLITIVTGVVTSVAIMHIKNL